MDAVTQPDQTVTVFEAEDGFLLFGAEAALAVVDEGYGADARLIPPQHLARVAGHLGSGAGRLSAESGRSLRLTEDRFASHAALDVAAVSADEPTRWIRAARDLAGDARSAVGAAGADVVGKARSVGQAIEERRDDRVLRRAEKIEEKRSRG